MRRWNFKFYSILNNAHSIILGDLIEETKQMGGAQKRERGTKKGNELWLLKMFCTNDFK